MPTPLPTQLVGVHIVSCTHIAPGHPVFLIVYKPTAAPGTQYVVKGEMPPGGNKGGKADGSLGTSFDMMREVARGGRARVLTRPEAVGFLYLAKTNIPDAAAKAYMTTLAGGLDQFSWLLLGYKVGLTNLEGVIQANDCRQAVQVLISLRDPENLDRLGRMLAVDMFLHNTDRFQMQPGQTGIQNAGNIFFVDKGDGTFRIKALDPFDYTKSKAILDNTINSKTYKDVSDPSYWQGSMLKKSREMERVARNALTSMWNELSGVLTGGGYPPSMTRTLRFTDEDVKRVVASMETAVRDMKAFSKQRLSGMRGAGAATAGLKSRMKIMGWST